MHLDKSTKYADYEWAIKLNRLTLNVVGIWPRVHESTYDKFLSDLRASFSLIVLVFIGMIPMLHALVVTWGDIWATVDTLQIIVPIFTSILKLMIIWRKKGDLMPVLDMMANDWLKSKTVKESYVMTKRAQTARVITIFGYSMMTFGFILVVLLPCFGKTFRYITNITDPNRPLPFPSYYMYDKESSPYFEVTYVAQAIISLVCVLLYTGVDNLMGLFVFHLCGQMENLRGKVAKMRQFGSINGGIAYIVQDHLRLIKFRIDFGSVEIDESNAYYNIIESTFTLLLLGLLLCFAMLFCLFGFLIANVVKGRSEVSFMRLVYLVSTVINMCGHMCLYCAVGEILVSQGEGIFHAVYNYNWYRMKPNQAKDLILIMIRAKKPLYITAGKIFPMTMSTFCSLIKTSAGYVSVLLATQGL